MALVRSLRADCDEPGCPRAVELDPEGVQPYIALLSAGWRSTIDGDDILIYCPEHRGEF